MDFPKGMSHHLMMVFYTVFFLSHPDLQKFSESHGGGKVEYKCTELWPQYLLQSEQVQFYLLN